MEAKSLSELPFAALLTYSPRGLSEVSERSRRVRDKLKAADPSSMRLALKRLQEVFEPAGFAAFLGPDVMLVPTPGSAPRLPGALWVPDRIARALHEAGLAKEVCPILTRTRAVPKSAFSPRGDRPDIATHIESMSAEATLMSSTRITLVDDFVTKGRTLFAAASVLAKVYPAADIRAFAVVRTRGLVHEIEAILDPCIGVIRFEESSGDVLREP